MIKDDILNLSTLRYKDLISEIEYKQHNYRTHRRLNIIMLILLLLYTIVNSLIYTYVKLDVTPAFEKIFHYNQITLYVVTCIYTFMLILSIATKSTSVHYWISIVAYFLMIFPNVMFRTFLSQLKIDYLVFSLIYTLQHLFRWSWFYLGLLDFLEAAVLTLSLCVTMVVYFIHLAPPEAMYRLSINNAMTLLGCVVAYFYVLERKKVFYYTNRLKRLNLWYHDLLENFNNGFIRIINDNIDIVNKVMVKNIMSSEAIRERFIEDSVYEINFIKNNTSLVLEDLLKNFKLENSRYELDELDRRFDIVQKCLQEGSNVEEYTFLGMTHIDTLEESVKMYYEVFGRYYLAPDHEGHLAHSYELVFNNVTNVKATESANTELKFKSIFLSKIAHEFKNPLLCIKELINQLIDKFDGQIVPQDILDNIKSMSDYLIILIKDMDFFSLTSIHSNRSITLDKDKTDLNELIAFCSGVTNSLIKKLHKEERVNLVVEKVNMPKYILTDDIKLKQILINLLSNAVKFTLNGTISLRVEGVNDSYIKFSIIDTGIGMTEEVQERLFKPFLQTDIEVNAVGSGLGLSIVKDLLKAFDSKIEYDTSLERGSHFQFSIKLEHLHDTIHMPSNLSPRSSLSCKTQIKEFDPLVSYRQISYSYINTIPTGIEFNLELGQTKEILVVDDEVMTRKSTVRLLKQYILKNNLNINIREASDGIECLYIYYQSIIQGNPLSMIISDQTMAVMNGGTCADIINDISKTRGYMPVPFVILTAYEISSLKNQCKVNEILTKPLTNSGIEKVIKLIV
jgi:signal transduction histidine kinase/CheY-like chemotaxis protein